MNPKHSNLLMAVIIFLVSYAYYLVMFMVASHYPPIVHNWAGILVIAVALFPSFAGLCIGILLLVQIRFM